MEDVKRHASTFDQLSVAIGLVAMGLAGVSLFINPVGALRYE